MNCFSFEKSVLSIDEIMAKTKLAKATIYRLLWTLERNDLVGYDQSLNKYRLGNKPLEYGGIVLANLDIRREADPYMQDLHEQTGYSIILATRQDESIQYLVRYDSDEGLMPTNFVGRRRTLHNGALGIVLLSYMDEEFVYDFLKRYPLEQHTCNIVISRSKNDDEYNVRSYFLFKRSRGSNTDIEEMFGERHDLIRKETDGWKIARRIIIPDQAVITTMNIAMFL
ncbi:IclR family transcriptional regulator domain-containing protein [Schinkia azotoformans]|uniref:IclR family transcriptional regulator domain-containing protein n=1 Tax=Schinkia azotoformans TaxID=1454 RepID=UPI002DBDEC67|nr:aromatic-ring-hydroxylating dioxygenase subunit beta [Schinkia azotoformans]MEC1722792.1 aromatic-ring-hydroxylating dioxygenase subunit beta [Schinkia azotoformans]MED4413112.1 aromatic-ring-hydroxylating dioxygenase subunit beta [Schinkia azotoformans]